MNQSQLFRLVDRAVDGRLTDILLEYRDQGLGPTRMALRLAAEYQVEVSGPTIKKWVDALPPLDAASRSRSAQAAQAAQSAQADLESRVAVAS